MKIHKRPNPHVQIIEHTVVEDKTTGAFRGSVAAEVFLNICVLMIVDTMTLVTCDPCQVRYQTCLTD